MQKGSLIGAGRTAEVFGWGRGQVLKLYREWCPPDWSAYEVTVVRALTAAGVAAPAVLDTAVVDGRQGIVFEEVPGRSLREQISAAPWSIGKAGRLLARLHADLHARKVAAPLPRLRERLAESIRDVREKLGGADADRMLARLELLPEGDRVCHFDFHPDNILGEGPAARAIDWNNASLGDPAADVARTLVVLRSPFIPEDVTGLLRRLVPRLKRWLATAYEREYLRRTGMERGAIEAWMAPVAAARLSEEIPDEEPWLLGLVRG